MGSGGMGKVAAKGARHSRERWPLWKLIFVALPQLGIQVLWCLIGPHSPPYMLRIGLGPAALATLVDVVGPVTGFFTGPIAGAASDGCTSRFGRRRPVILAGLASTWVAGLLFASAEDLLPRDRAAGFAAAMYWVVAVAVNVLQIPHRALVADLASERQQVPLQAVFVLFMAIGNLLGYAITQIYDAAAEHMFALMVGVCSLNTVCIAVHLLIVAEQPLQREVGALRESVCAPVCGIVRVAKGSPRLLYHLAAVQCLVWIGSTAWNIYGEQWFTTSVFVGDQSAPDGSQAKMDYNEGMIAFGHGGQASSMLQLISSLGMITILLKRLLRPRLVYAPCIFVGGLASVLAALVVGHSGGFAMLCMTLSVMPETGSFAIPFALVAAWNKRAEDEGREASTALQMALLNCCVIAGRQICTMIVAAIEGGMSLQAALPCIFIMAATMQVLAGGGALCLDDAPPAKDAGDCGPGLGRATQVLAGSGALFFDDAPPAGDGGECGPGLSRVSEETSEAVGASA